MKNEPLILAIETSVRQGSLSVLKGERVVAARTLVDGISASESLLKSIADLLCRVNLSLKHIELIAVSTGPGSFTGVRVGVATALALSAGTKRPCFGVSILEALAYSAAGSSQNLVAAVPSGRDQLFWQSFTADDTGSRTKGEIQKGECGDLVTFVETRSNKEDLKVVLESSVHSVLAGKCKEWALKRNTENASDNAAGCIGQKAYREFATNAAETELITACYPA